MNAPGCAAALLAKLRTILTGQKLVAGEFYSAFRDGVGVVVTPLLSEERVGEADHELTVTAGLPFQAETISGLTIGLTRIHDGALESVQLEGTNEVGSLLFAPGPPGAQYSLDILAQGCTETHPVPVQQSAAAKWCRREEVALGASTPGNWVALEAGPVVLASTPRDQGLRFSFPEAPTFIARALARAQDGTTYHELFPLRPAPERRGCEGQLHLPVNTTWDEVFVEPLTPGVIAGLCSETRQQLAKRLESRLQDWGLEQPFPGREPTYRDLWRPLAVLLANPGPKPTPEITCPVCLTLAHPGATASVKELADGLATGVPICQSHLIGRENLIVAAGRTLWHTTASDRAEIITQCEQLQRQLLDGKSCERRTFLRDYPDELHPRATKQLTGILGAVAALGHFRAGALETAGQIGSKAAWALQAALGFDASPQSFVGPGKPTTEHPLIKLWFRVATELEGRANQGYHAFRSLTESMICHHLGPVPFPPLRDQPVVARPLLYDRARGAGVLARLEFTPIPEGDAVLYFDLGSLGLRVLDSQFLRGFEIPWQALRPVFLRHNPDLAVCVRVIVGDHVAPVPTIQGGSAGLAAACALLALRDGEILDSDTAITGELLPHGTSHNLEEFCAGWTSRVSAKLGEARNRGLLRAVVGITGQSNWQREIAEHLNDPGFEVIPVKTVEEAYRAIRRGPLLTAAQLQDDGKRRAFLRGWLNSLPTGSSGGVTPGGAPTRLLTVDTMRKLISAHRLLLDADLEDTAHRLVTEFDDESRRCQVQPATAQLGDILDTLRYGLPREAVHIPRLEIGVEELLARPGYPALLRAIRSCEIDPPRGVRELEDLIRQPMFRRSAFVLYLLGQALRKEERLGEALQILERAEALTRNGTDPATDELRLAVLRGLAAVCRKLGNLKLDRALRGDPDHPGDDSRSWHHFRDQAESYFRAGETLIRRLPPSKQSTTADFFHSRAYFEMQFGYQEWKLTGRESTPVFQQALRESAHNFRLATQTAPSWGAPEARLNMVLHKLWQTGVEEAGKGLEAGYILSRQKTCEEARSKPEAGLTEILCGCGLILLARSPAVRLTPARLLQDLTEALCRRIESRGARQCHDFDLAFLLDGVSMHSLGEVAALLREAAHWDDLGYARFVFAQAQACLATGQATLPTVANWISNARKLLADHLHHDPGNPAAVEMNSEVAVWCQGIGLTG